MGHGGDVIAGLTADHREVDELFAQIEDQGAGDERRRELAGDLATKLAAHFAAEQQLLYPAARECVAGGDEIANQALTGHAALSLLLEEVEQLHAGAPQFDLLVARLRLEAHGHIRDQEERLFPLMSVTCTPGLLDERGDKVRSARKRTAHPHPLACEEMDRVRDLMPGRSTY